MGEFVSNFAFCGPPLTLSLALECWGPPNQYGFCGQSAHACEPLLTPPLPCSKELGTPTQQDSCSQSARFLATFDFASCFEALWRAWGWGGAGTGPFTLTPPPPSLLVFGWEVPDHGRQRRPKELLLELVEGEKMGFQPMCMYSNFPIFFRTTQ